MSTTTDIPKNILKRAFKLKALIKDPGARTGEVNVAGRKLIELIGQYPGLHAMLNQADVVELKLPYRTKKERTIGICLFDAYGITSYGYRKGAKEGNSRIAIKGTFGEAPLDLRDLIRDEYDELVGLWNDLEHGIFSAFLHDNIERGPLRETARAEAEQIQMTEQDRRRSSIANAAVGSFSFGPKRGRGVLRVGGAE